MKQNDIIDAIGMIDDDLIESADKLRQKNPVKKSHYLRPLITAACVCLAVGVAVFFARYITDLPGLLPHDTDTDTAVETIHTDEEYLGVTIEKDVIDESFGYKEDTIGYFSHNGRIYFMYKKITDLSVIGEKLGTTVDVFASKPYGDYYGELHGNISFDVHQLNGYPEEFMLAVGSGDLFFAYICDNGITLKTGKEIYEHRLGLVEQMISASFYFPDESTMHELEDAQLSTIRSFITSLYDGKLSFLSDIPFGARSHDANLTLTLNGGIEAKISLFNGKYVRFEGQKFGNILTEVDPQIYNSFLTFLKASVFDPDKFAELIPSERATVQFWHKLFANNIYLYFCTSKYDPSQLSVYYTRDNGDTIGAIDITIPDELTYDSLMPVYAGGGGGSGECEIIIKLTADNSHSYISFNNFSYTDHNNILDFKYGGTVSEARMEQLRSSYPDSFHISELMTHNAQLPDDAPFGIYLLASDSNRLVVEIGSDMTDAQLLAALGIDSGKNMAHGYISDIKFNVTAGNECSVDSNYFIHTKSGDIALDKDDVISIFALANVTVKSEPFSVIDEFNDSVTANLHTYGGKVMSATAEPYNLMVDGRYVRLAASDNFRLTVTTLPKGHITSRQDVYVPLTATLKALGYGVSKKNGNIIADGSLDLISAPIPYSSTCPENIEYVLSVDTLGIFVNGKTCEYKGRALITTLAGSHRVTMYSYNDIYMYNGEYYIQPEFLAEMLNMDTDYISEFYTRDTE